MCTSIVIGCGSKKTETTPAYVVDKQKLINVTVDLKIIEGAINLNHYNRVTDKETIDSLYKSVYNKHKITKAKIDTSLVYYSTKPKLLSEIYDSVLVKLSKYDL